MTNILASKATCLAMLALATVALSAPSKPSAEALVRTAERQWLDAEYHGDTAALMKLLLPDYRTVSSNGVHGRDELIAAVAKRGGRSVEPPYPTPKIEIHGTTALAIFAAGDTSYSVDVFVFEKEAWHALHSQHTDMKKKY
jgi:hypothetical protein